MAKKLKTFLTDSDGISMKDWLMFLSSTVFFLFVTVGLIMSLLGNSIDSVYLELLDTVSPVIITITSGVFGVNAVETFVNRKKNNTNKQEEHEDGVYYEDEYIDTQQQNNTPTI